MARASAAQLHAQMCAAAVLDGGIAFSQDTHSNAAALHEMLQKTALQQANPAASTPSLNPQVAASPDSGLSQVCRLCHAPSKCASHTSSCLGQQDVKQYASECDAQDLGLQRSTLGHAQGPCACCRAVLPCPGMCYASNSLIFWLMSCLQKGQLVSLMEQWAQQLCPQLNTTSRGASMHTKQLWCSSVARFCTSAMVRSTMVSRMALRGRGMMAVGSRGWQACAQCSGYANTTRSRN